MARFLGAARGRPYFHYEITVRGEMRPAEHNRVVPTAERDAFGLPRLSARCVLDAGDYRNAEDTLRALGETLMRLERGRVRVNNDRIYLQVDGQGHTLGTTRMGEDASTVGRRRRLPRPRLRQSLRRRIVGLPERRLCQPDDHDRRTGAAAGRSAGGKGLDMTTPRSGLSRRALFGVGGSTLLAAAAATAWRWRTSQAEAAPPSRADAPISYADHDGWMVSVAEKQALQAGFPEPAGAGR